MVLQKYVKLICNYVMVHMHRIFQIQYDVNFLIDILLYHLVIFHKKSLLRFYYEINLLLYKCQIIIKTCFTVKFYAKYKTFNVNFLSAMFKLNYHKMTFV